MYMDYPPRPLPRQICQSPYVITSSTRQFSLGYERVYMPLCEVEDTPFHIQGDDNVQENTRH